MENVQLALNEKGHGAFFIEENNERIAEMIVSVSGQNLTAYHTEVFPKGEGKGLGKQLLATMVEYTRNNHLKVIPLCPFVHAQFKRYPALYADVWNKEGK
jgi:predicted GNAT family acetyltransferase